MRRIIVFLIAISIVFNLIPVFAKAEFCCGKAELIQAGDFGGSQIIPSEKTGIQLYSAEDSVYQVLYEGMKNSQTKIDIAKYNIKEDDIVTVFSTVINSNPDLFYVSNYFGYYRVDGYVTVFAPQYYDEYNTDECKERFETEADYIISDIIKDGMSDEDKVLALHDYLVMNVTYDMDFYKGEGNYDMITHSAYAALVNEVAVCSGYALAFKYLLNHLDIDCICFTSNDMVHAWNGVKLDGKWYHIDATWDDPTFTDEGGISGYVSHDYFLLSDETMIIGRDPLRDDSHYGWAETDVICDSKKYETGYPFSEDKDGATGFVYENGGFYYIKYLQTIDNKLYTATPKLMFSKFDGSNLTEKKTVGAKANLCFMQYHDGRVFMYCWEYGAPNDIFEYNIQTDNLIKIAQSPVSEVRDYKLGLDIKSDKLLWYAYHSDSMMTEYEFEKDIEEITIGKPILKGALHVDKFTAREAIENGLKLSISNHTDNKKEYDVYFAYYKDGIMMGISSTRVTVPKHSHKIAILEKLAEDGKKADDVRIFMMDEVFSPEVNEGFKLK